MVFERAIHRGHFRFQFYELKFLLHFTGRSNSKWNVHFVQLGQSLLFVCLWRNVVPVTHTFCFDDDDDDNDNDGDDLKLCCLDSMEFFELYWHSIVAPTVWIIISVLMQLPQSHSRNILTTIMNTWCALTKTIIAIVAVEREKGSESRKKNLRQIVSKHFKSLSTNVTCVITHADNFQCDWIPNSPITSP